MRPSSRIREAGERRQSQLLAMLLVLFIPMAGLAMVIRPLVLRSGSLWSWPVSAILLAGFVLFLGGYVLNRMGRCLVASIVVVGAQFAMIFFYAVTAASRSRLTILAYLVVPTLFGSVFLTPRISRLVTTLGIVGMLALMLVVPAAELGGLVNLFMGVSIVSVLILAASAYRDDLERKRQARLVASETRYRTLIEQMPAISYLTDPNDLTRPLFVSPQIETVLGFTPEEWIGSSRPSLEQLHPDDRQRILAEFSAAEIDGRLASEYRIFARDGRLLWMRDEARLILDSNGRPLFMQGIMVDVSDLKRAEEDLHKRNAEMELLYQVSRQLSQTLNLEDIYQQIHSLVAQRMDCDGLFVSSYDVDRQIIRCEYAWHEGSRLDAGTLPPIPLEPVGYGIQSEAIRTRRPLIIPDFVARLQQTQANYAVDVHGAVAEDMPEDAERTRSALVAPLVMQDRVTGVIQVLSYRCDAYTPSDLAFLEALASVAAIAGANARLYQRAVDELMERRRMEEALQASEAQLRAVVDSAHDSIFIKDADMVYRLVNRAMGELFKAAPADLVGRTDTELFGAEAAAQIEEDDRRVLAGEPVAVEATRVIAGVAHALDSVNVPLRNARGQIVGICGISRDVTERKRMHSELLKAQRLESLGILAGGIAHDFNNLLMAILGNVNLARLSTAPGSEVHELLMQAEKASLRAQELTQQLLTFSKGGAPIRKSASVTELLRDTATFATRGSRVRCEFRLAADLWPAEIDAGQISQVVHNIVLNAVQAMPAGGTLEIAASNAQVEAGEGLPLVAGRYIAISVRDEGIGIPPDHLSKIFDPYFSTKQKGSGLGLATAFSIVKRHDGCITVESVLGKGTTFHVYLPAATTAPTVELAAGTSARAGRGRVLVVDDEEMVRAVAGRLLERLGYEPALAADGEAGVHAYREALMAGHPFDAVIMDLTIPGGMGGREAVGRLLDMDPGARVLVSSGYSNDPIMADCTRYGFCGVIAKPYEIESLAATLRGLVGA